MTEWTICQNEYRAEVEIYRYGNGYSVFATRLPGCASQGNAIAECKQNIREALRGCIECYLETGRIPWLPAGERVDLEDCDYRDPPVWSGVVTVKI